MGLDVDPETGNTALHFACCGGAPISVVRALLDLYPDATGMKDSDENIPLMGAVANGCSASVIQALLKADPQGIYVRTPIVTGGHTLLHSAACNGASEEIVRVLLAAWPGASEEVDEEGNTPLHFAAARQGSEEIVRALLSANPGAAKQRGYWNRYPLSLALLNEAHPDVIQLIRDAYPDAQREECMVADYMNHGLGCKRGKMIGSDGKELEK